MTADEKLATSRVIPTHQRYNTSPVYAFVSAGLGSALADVFSGYLVYAPATFVIKGLMALVAFAFCKILAKNHYF